MKRLPERTKPKSHIELNKLDGFGKFFVCSVLFTAGFLASLFVSSVLVTLFRFIF